MSQLRLSSTSKGPGRRPRTNRLGSISSGIDGHIEVRRASASSASKVQRTSKTSQKLVVLPSAPQTKLLQADNDEDLTLGYETDAGITVREYKSEAERMSKEQRHRAGYKRLTAYCVAEVFNMKLLTSYLKREHNVSPRIFDEAMYAMYHLPLLPGYGPSSNIRSSAFASSDASMNIQTRLSEAEENGYQGTYFPHNAANSSSPNRDGYILSSPVMARGAYEMEISEAEHTTVQSDTEREAESPEVRFVKPPEQTINTDDVAEVVFFEYGVVVFFGLDEGQERNILEDIENAKIMDRKITEVHWEVEECHFAYDTHIAYPRIYNDFFTLKSRSHLLKLSIAHALAQSTLLARYETNAQRVLSSPSTLSIPKQLAESGALQLRRNEALKLTGRLFKLRRDINLVSNVLDVPELFWDEASLKGLYDAVREYMEIKGRVQVLNEKLGIASDFLDAIHEHLNNSAMERITWIVIWLIVVAIIVDLGEVVARLIFHAALDNKPTLFTLAPVISKEEVLYTLDRMASN
ncbi:DUF155-domain-containing protein [Guyanagaster necrorhizus]|uniref:DUF155-domain-containing protein n=1 Tax=Guyanagaster necrorhizus TaxID=856835 RepID=A0A9P7VWB7_9AGAR|nr:DUF155-domain-containing protein [Guyanagaster necrorhizus MCA 3950]KAG7448726.1 DUF155-domain-containing protein [Guyanagaster necrorhizus MCA 3950]